MYMYMSREYPNDVYVCVQETNSHARCKEWLEKRLKLHVFNLTISNKHATRSMGTYSLCTLIIRKGNAIGQRF